MISKVDEISVSICPIDARMAIRDQYLGISTDDKHIDGSTYRFLEGDLRDARIHKILGMKRRRIVGKSLIRTFFEVMPKSHYQIDRCFRLPSPRTSVIGQHRRLGTKVSFTFLFGRCGFLSLYCIVTGLR